MIHFDPVLHGVEVSSGLPVLIVGLTDPGYAYVVDSTGEARTILWHKDDLSINWRYDFKTESWVDLDFRDPVERPDRE